MKNLTQIKDQLASVEIRKAIALKNYEKALAELEKEARALEAELETLKAEEKVKANRKLMRFNHAAEKGKSMVLCELPCGTIRQTFYQGMELVHAFNNEYTTIESAKEYALEFGWVFVGEDIV